MSTPAAPEPAAVTAASAGGRRRVPVIAAVALAVAMLLAFSLSAGLGLVQQARERQAWVTQTRQVQLGAEQLRAAVRGLGRSALGALALPPAAQLERLQHWRAEVERALQRLQASVVDDAPQAERTAALAALLRDHLQAYQAAARAGGGDAAWQAGRRQRAERVELQIDALQQHEATRLAQRERQFAEHLTRLGHGLAWLIAAVLAGLLLAAVLILREVRQRGAAELRARRSAEALQRANDGLEQRVAERTEGLRQAAAAQALRSALSQQLMAATDVDDADEAAVLERWRQRVLEAGLADQLALRLRGHPPMGEVDPEGADQAAASGLARQVQLDLPQDLGTLRYRRARPPGDARMAQAAAARAADIAADLATWLTLRGHRRERLRAEQARDRMATLLDALFEQAPLALALVDRGGGALRANGPAAALGVQPGAALPAALQALAAQAWDDGQPLRLRALDWAGPPPRRLLLSLAPLRPPPAAAAAPSPAATPSGTADLALIALDVSELETARLRQLALARRLLRAEEDERQALARELHDDLAQRLAALKINLQMAERSAGDAALRARIAEDSLALVDGCIAQVRERATTLRPAQLDELGLAAALHGHLQAEGRRHGVAVKLTLALPEAALDRDWCSHVFRIVQEALRNAFNHGRPAAVAVDLRDDGQALVLTVDDDGRGLPEPLTPGLGTAHMRERTELMGGRFALGPAPGGGTRLRCLWPRASALAANADPAVPTDPPPPPQETR